MSRRRRWLPGTRPAGTAGPHPKRNDLNKKKPGSLRLRGPAARRLAKNATTVAFLPLRGRSLPTYAPSVGKPTNERFIAKRLRKPERRRESLGREPETFRADKKIPRRASRPAGLQTKKSPAATYFRASKALSSAQESLTSVFGMGTGIASPPWPPDKINQLNCPTTGEKREDSLKEGS